MPRSRSVAFAVGCATLLVSGYLVLDRGGLLAWLGLVLASVLIIKTLLWPAANDALVSVTVLALWALAWGATWAYVVSEWESGEVVEIDVAGSDTARTWVLDMTDGPVMYYDAPPIVASRLLAGAPISVIRDSNIRHGCASATRIEEVPDEQLQRVFSQMDTKYQERNHATEVFYAVLGSERDRIALLLRLVPCQ